MKSKTKQCQNCKAKFIIESEDFEFYKKIDVPEPTFCPDCRAQRRMAFRKEGPYFYKRKCDATGKDLISFFHPESPVKIYDQKYWWSDKWDATKYGRDYDFNKPFFEQFKELFLNVPQIAISRDAQSVNSDYCASSNFMKNCYLVNNSSYNEDVSYSNRVLESKDSLDLYLSNKLELCYQNIYCSNSYKLFFSNHCDSCVESAFLYDCRNCQNCFGCTNLRNKKYHIFNKQYTKKEYEELIPKIRKHMNKMPYIDEKGRIYKYGEFFPFKFSPFGYNETIANEYFPLAKQQTKEQGYNWYDRPKSEYQPTVKASDLPDHIKDVDKSILKENIECDNKDCQGTGVFKIIPKEFKFYQKLNISLPRLCPDCRYRERVKKTNPLKLWHRKCQCAGHYSDNKVYKNTIEHPHHKDKHCSNEFETTYSPDRK